MSNRRYTIEIPVKPYIKKYVASIEGSPINFSAKSPICIMIMAFLEGKSSLGYSKEQHEASLRQRTEKIQVLVPMSKIRQIGFHISAPAAILINKFLEDQFDRDLVFFIDKNIQTSGRYRGYKNAYELFAEKFAIEIDRDISLDGLQKKDYRYRKNSSNVVLSQNSPNLAPILIH